MCPRSPPEKRAWSRGTAPSIPCSIHDALPTICNGPNYSGERSHIEAHNFYPIFIPLDECKVSGVSVQPSRWPKKTASLIGKETNERPTSNFQHRTSNECILSVLIKISRSDSILRHSSFVIRYSAVRCLIQAIETGSLITMKLCHLGVVSYEDMLLPLSFLTPET
jgi:hypothetical protein